MGVDGRYLRRSAHVGLEDATTLAGIQAGMTTREQIQPVLDAVEHEIKVLYETVRDYESDTFSASGSKLTGEELVDIVVRLINHAVHEMSECNTLDGCRLTEELADIRDEEV